MKLSTFVVAALVFAAALPSVPAAAQNARSFVSGHGSDGNDCSYALPCRTFAGAIAKTNAGGEISVLDPAGYGKVTITKAMSIVNDGVGEVGMLFVAAGDGITVNAGINDIVNLRGLTIDGGGAGTNGIVFNSGASLTIDNCLVRRFTQFGVQFAPTGASRLSVADTVSSDNSIGIMIDSHSGTVVTASINHVRLNNNGRGLQIYGGNGTGAIAATAYDTIATGSSQMGFYAVTTPGHASAALSLFHSVAANNGVGIEADDATIRVAQSMVTGNTLGWIVFNAGAVQTYGDNYINGNASNETAPTSIARK